VESEPLPYDLTNTGVKAANSSPISLRFSSLRAIESIVVTFVGEFNSSRIPITSNSLSSNVS